MKREFEDEDGAKLFIESCGNPHYFDVRASEGGACMAPDKLPAVVAALYAAAGKPEPVILDRPEPRDCLVPGAGDEGSWVDVERSPAAGHGRGIAEPGRPGVSLILRRLRPDGSDASVRLIGDEPLRVAIALAEAMRPAADEPDPAEVEELAELMNAEMERRDNGQFGLYPACARIALQWIQRREAQS